jgi:hypothetical protein
MNPHAIWVCKVCRTTNAIGRVMCIGCGGPTWGRRERWAADAVVAVITVVAAFGTGFLLSWKVAPPTIIEVEVTPAPAFEFNPNGQWPQTI